MMIVKNKKFQFCIDIFLIVLGTFFMSLGFNIFLVPNKLTPSGFSGLASLISVWIAGLTGVVIPTSILYLAMNIILFVFAIKFLGKRFAISTIIGIAFYTLFLEFIKFPTLSASLPDDLLLSSIFGGIIMGIGLGLVFRGKGSTGGSDLLATLINSKNPSVSLGTIVIFIDIIVIGLSIFVYGLEYSLYSLIAIYIMGKVSDIVVAGVQSVRAYYIISKHSDIIADRIMRQTSRGVTGLQVNGMYTKASKTMLMVLVTRAQVSTLKYIVADCDDSAFMFSTPISEAMGAEFVPIRKSKYIKLGHLNEPKYKRYVPKIQTKFIIKKIKRKSKK